MNAYQLTYLVVFIIVSVLTWRERSRLSVGEALLTVMLLTGITGSLGVMLVAFGLTVAGQN